MLYRSNQLRRPPPYDPQCFPAVRRIPGECPPPSYLLNPDGPLPSPRLLHLDAVPATVHDWAAGFHSERRMPIERHLGEDKNHLELVFPHWSAPPAASRRRPRPWTLPWVREKATRSRCSPAWASGHQPHPHRPHSCPPDDPPPPSRLGSAAAAACPPP